MGVAESFKGAGLFAKIALVLLLIAALFAWIAFTCTGWGVEKNGFQHYGLWRICSDSDRSPGCSIIDGWANVVATQGYVSNGLFAINVATVPPILFVFVIISDWWASTQAFVSIGFFGINVALVLLILYMFVGSCQRNGEVAMATTIVCFATGTAYLIGVIVFGVEFKDKFIDQDNNSPLYPDNDKDFALSYCFGLSIVALIFEIVAGIFVILDSKKGGALSSS